MQLALIQRILGLFLILFSVTLIPPIGVSIGYHDGELKHFVASMALTLIVGLVLWLPVKSYRRELRTRDGFFVVAMFWVVFCGLSALPLLFGPHLSYTDAFFEAVSGFTTTGATVITGLDKLPPSILYYRQQIQWLGGMGIIVLAVAILPMLGVGGMQLYRAETPGPMKDEKLTPRITHSARTFWLIYAGLTAACAIGYWAAGMSWFDAIGHSFSTLSSGGFSTHDASMGYFHNANIDAIADVFMLLGAMNFSVHYLALRGRSPLAYWRDSEVRTFVLVVGVVTAVIMVELMLKHRHEDPLEALRYSAFQTISVITSTGFTTEDFSKWPAFVPVLLLISSFMGGCAGSTAGGMKVIRMLIIFKQWGRDLVRLVHPTMVRPLKVGGRVVPERIIDAVWGFFAIYIGIYVLFMLALMAGGMDQVTAFSAVATCMNNMGPGLGGVSANFQSVSPWAKWLLSAAMLMGRLEIFTLLVLISPSFWRR